MYHADRVLFSRNSTIFNLIPERAGFDSHVPRVLPAQFLPGMIVVVLGGCIGLTLGWQMAWTGRCPVLQPVCWPKRWLVR